MPAMRSPYSTAEAPRSVRRRLVQRVNRARPDLVTLLGDYADPAVYFGERIEPHEVAAVLGKLHAPLGTFAVLGNHDWVEHGAEMPRALRAAGIDVLENDAVQLRHAQTPSPRQVSAARRAGVSDLQLHTLWTLFRASGAERCAA